MSPALQADSYPMTTWETLGVGRVLAISVLTSPASDTDGCWRPRTEEDFQEWEEWLGFNGWFKSPALTSQPPSPLKGESSQKPPLNHVISASRIYGLCWGFLEDRAVSRKRLRDTFCLAFWGLAKGLSGTWIFTKWKIEMSAHPWTGRPFAQIVPEPPNQLLCAHFYLRGCQHSTFASSVLPEKAKKPDHLQDSSFRTRPLPN